MTAFLMLGSTSLAKPLERGGPLGQTPQRHKTSEGGPSVMLKNPVVCGEINGLVTWLTNKYGETLAMGWVDGQTQEPVMLFYNHATQSITIIERLSAKHMPEGMEPHGCVLSGGKDVYVSDKFIEERLGDSI